MAKKKVAKKGKRMAMGGPAMTPGMTPGRGMGREMEDDESERGEMEDGMERRMRRGRDREMERGNKMGYEGRGQEGILGGIRDRKPKFTNYPGIERPGGMNTNRPGQGVRPPALGGGLPPVQNMGPGNMPPGKMPGAPATGITQNAAQLPPNQSMMRNMGPNNMAPVKMRGGGIARKGKGLTMAKGGLVKGCGCVSKGTKKPRYT